MNSFLFETQVLITKGIRLFYSAVNGGQNCVICDNSVSLVPLCKKCRNVHFQVDKETEKKRCKACGKVLISTEDLCMQCREEKVLRNVDRMLPLFSYRLWNKELMFLWKQKEIRSLSEVFAQLIRDGLEKMGIRNVVPVPPRKGKIQEKGWDQIEDMCRFLEFRYGFKIFRILERTSLIQQKKLDRKERLQTIGNAYSLKNNVENLPDELCIIDDVMTTGATLENCSQILKKAGVKRVNAITLFIVD